MALDGNPVEWARHAEANATQARELATDPSAKKLAEAVAQLSWAVALMADRLKLESKRY